MTPADEQKTRAVPHKQSHKKGLIHAIADCTVCGKHWEDYRTAQKKAAAHAAKTGHKVIIDLGYMVEYGT